MGHSIKSFSILLGSPQCLNHRIIPIRLVRLEAVITVADARVGIVVEARDRVKPKHRVKGSLGVKMAKEELPRAHVSLDRKLSRVSRGLKGRDTDLDHKVNHLNLARVKDRAKVAGEAAPARAVAEAAEFSRRIRSS